MLKARAKRPWSNIELYYDQVNATCSTQQIGPIIKKNNKAYIMWRRT